MLPSRIFFDSFLDDFEDNKFKKMMKCDIYEKDGNYNVIMDIPGFSKEDINIECDNGIIKISCEKKEENNEEDDKKYLRRERRYEKCERSFNFGDIKEDEIEAELVDGTLTLIIPKREKVDTRKNIEIK
ncbi:MAG: Hsp20 family protein [Bacilli bacterium]|nr:Hsp20 family protein [Bacilli bacterium]